MSSRSGQALIEFLGSTAVALAVLAGGAALWKNHWERARCAYLVFEQTHAARAGSPPAFPRAAVRVEATESGFRGEARCGGSREVVQLPKLEASEW